MKRAAAVLLLLTLSLPGCTKQPPELDPEAQVAFHATRAVRVLDVLRDAAIAANELSPPVISTNDTRTVVLWHRSAVQVIQAAPAGWQSTVKATLYQLTCHPIASPVPIPGTTQPCVPQLPPSASARLYPYVALVVTVINEVK